MTEALKEIAHEIAEEKQPTKLETSRIETTADLVRIIAEICARKETLTAIDYQVNREKIEGLTKGFNSHFIVRCGRMQLLEEMMATLTGISKSDIKKYLQALVLTAKFISRFNSVKDFQNHFQKEMDSQGIFWILDNFRRESGLYSMTFNKITAILNRTETLDIPVFVRTSSELLKPLLGSNTTNEEVYSAMLELQKKTGLRGAELTARLEAYAEKHLNETKI